MLKKSALMFAGVIGIIMLSYLFTGCGIRPQMDFYINPVPAGEEQRVDSEKGTVTFEIEKGINITVSPVDTSELLQVTSNVYLNPYIYVSDWGIARPRYTVFDVTVKNDTESDYVPHFTDAVLMDDEGEQYEAIPQKELEDRYESLPLFEREIIYYPSYRLYRPSPYRYGSLYRPWYYHYDIYHGRRSYEVVGVRDVSYLARVILKGTMLKDITLYPGGKSQGFLVFPRVAPDAAELKLIFPSAIFIGQGDEAKRLEFRFKRVPAKKKD